MECWESDDIAFSIHSKAGYLDWLYGRCRRRTLFEPATFHEWVSSGREEVMACWDRLYHDELSTEGQMGVLSKSFIMLFYLEEFFEKYPDAKVILLTRTPLEVVPSTISLVNSVTRRLFPFRQLHDTAIENIYHSVSLYYQRMSSVLANQTIADRCLHVEYSDIISHLTSTCTRVSNYLSHGSWDKEAVSAQAVKQSQWKSRHHYDASDFGLPSERIAQEVPYA